MRKAIKNARSKLVHAKVFVQRSLSYVAILNSGMILFLVLSRLENYNIDINLEFWLVPIFILTIGLMILFGYIEDKLGFFKEESKAVNQRNPVLIDIDKRLQKIEMMLQNGKTR